MKMVIIGSRGHHGYAITPLPRFPELEVAAISSGCEDSPESLLKALERVGRHPGKIYADYREMLSEVRPDIAVIDGPFHLHAEMCIEALKLPCHIFCEKPIALTVRQLLDIEQAYLPAADQCKLISMVGLRAEPPFRTAFEVISSGRLGKVRMVNTRKSYKLGERPDFYRSRETYGGTIPWVGSHALDWIYWMGGAKFRTLQAVHSREGNRNHGELEMSALVMCALENGVLGSASIDYLRPQSASTHGDDQVRVACDKGVIEVVHSKVFLTDAEGERELPLLPECNIFEDFAESLLRGTPCIVDAADTFELTRACLLAREAADKAVI